MSAPPPPPPPPNVNLFHLACLDWIKIYQTPSVRLSNQDVFQNTNCQLRAVLNFIHHCCFFLVFFFCFCLLVVVFFVFVFCCCLGFFVCLFVFVFVLLFLFLC